MSTTSLGMPGLPPRTAQPTWKQAWDAALYGPDGYLRSNPLALHRPSGELLEFLLPRLARHSHAVLLGAAGVLAPEVASRLPGVSLRGDVPTGFTGIVVAVDWLSHVPTHVVQADDDDRPRVVHVDPISGQETLGLVVTDPGVPPTINAWLERHWPLAGGFARAEVGTTRTAAWLDVLRCLASGEAIAIEHSHGAALRPTQGSLRSDQGPTIPDGTRDLVADVALDAVAEECGSILFEAGQSDAPGPTRIENHR